MGREPSYALADLMVDTTRTAPAEVARIIAEAESRSPAVVVVDSVQAVREQIKQTQTEVDALTNNTDRSPAERLASGDYADHHR